LKNLIDSMKWLIARGAIPVVLVALWMSSCVPGQAWAGETELPEVAVIVSEPIRPYQEALSSLKEVLNKKKVQVMVFEMEGDGKGPTRDLKAAFSSRKYQIWVSIGPQATRFLWSGKVHSDINRIYGMVLNPEEIIGDGCGVPMNIPIKEQVRTIEGIFPEFRRIGILYDPKYNQDFVRVASQEAAAQGTLIVPVAVSSQREIRRVLGSSWTRIDAVWLIPDFTVISEPVVRYIIKEGLANKTPIIGYNRFFFHSGAVMSFVLDYGRMGEQMALLCLEVMAGRPCTSLPPFFEVWVNSRALQILGLKIDEQRLPNLKVMP